MLTLNITINYLLRNLSLEKIFFVETYNRNKYEYNNFYWNLYPPVKNKIIKAALKHLNFLNNDIKC